MAMDFPSSPTERQVFNAAPGVSYEYFSGVWRPAPMKTALPKNYVVNPSMQISQEIGDTIISPGAGVAGSCYPADQWVLYHAAIPGASIATLGQSIHVNNINRWVQFYTNNGPLTVNAGDYAQCRQYIEGQRCADFKWGTADAVDLVLRFDFLGVSGQVYHVGVYTPDFYYLQKFSGVGYQTASFAIPGCTTGTFNTGASTYGVFINFNCLAGTTYQDSQFNLGKWRAWPPKYGSTVSTSFIQGTASSFQFSNVGLYLDPFKTGVAPPYEHPDIFEELRRCQRYYAKLYGMRGWMLASNQVIRPSQQLPAPMRIAPALSMAGAPQWYDGTASALASATVAFNGSNEFVAELNGTAAAGLTGNRPAVQFWNSDANYWAANARM